MQASGGTQKIRGAQVGFFAQYSPMLNGEAPSRELYG